MRDIVIDAMGRRRVLRPADFLRDGERLVVAVTMMDSGQRSGALVRQVDASETAYDGLKRDLSHAWRGSEAERDDRQLTADDAFVDNCQWLEGAWRGPPAEARQHPGVKADARQTADQAHEEMVTDLTNAWRNAA